ncbi:MAG TPA: choline/ethanolamine kinase family protein [Steroidobacteraceae bacterium]|nr:choline/ethanolamine kinase family protein [Steroidobacteraceae bacterium]
MPERPGEAAALREREVREALAADVRTRRLASAPLQVWDGGLSNHAWCAQSGGLRYFVRLSPPGAAGLGVDRDRECALLRSAADAGLAPVVVHCEPSLRLLVTRWVEGSTLSRDQAIEPDNLSRVARAMRRLHGLPVDPRVGPVDFHAQVRRIEPQCPPLTREERGLAATAAEAMAMLDATAPPRTLCHNDFHHLNLIDEQGRLWIVDWEYGGAGDPRFDLASFLCQHETPPGVRAGLLAAYGAGPATATGGLEAACWLFDYVQWLWYRASPTIGPAAAELYHERARALGEKLRGASPRGPALQ